MDSTFVQKNIPAFRIQNLRPVEVALFLSQACFLIELDGAFDLAGHLYSLVDTVRD
jgi:hypothetical protein